MPITAWRLNTMHILLTRSYKKLTNGQSVRPHCVSITLAPLRQTACHGNPPPLTTMVIHSRQVWNHHNDTLRVTKAHTTSPTPHTNRQHKTRTMFWAACAVSIWLAKLSCPSSVPPGSYFSFFLTPAALWILFVHCSLFTRTLTHFYLFSCASSSST